MAINDGGPAFPRPAGDYNGTKHGNGAQVGISMRDYFAAKAMAAMVASPDYVEGEWFQEDIALQAYTMADAMLLARAKDASHE